MLSQLFASNVSTLFLQNQIKKMVPQDHVWKCSNYITGLIFDVLKEMFYNARDIQVCLVPISNGISVFLSDQEWLAVSAKKISSAGKPVEWVTPLGLPIIQPYHKPVVSEVTAIC